jgi:hypothetical protein
MGSLIALPQTELPKSFDMAFAMNQLLCNLEKSAVKAAWVSNQRDTNLRPYRPCWGESGGSSFCLSVVGGTSEA